jgi:hypothetical protein
MVVRKKEHRVAVTTNQMVRFGSIGSPFLLSADRLAILLNAPTNRDGGSGGPQSQYDHHIEATYTGSNRGPLDRDLAKNALKRELQP